MSSLPEGWYKDPADPSTQRWWDGEGWLGKAIPADQTPPDGPPPAEEPEPVAPAVAPPEASEPPAAEAPVIPPPPDPPAQGLPWGPPPSWQQPPPGWPQPPGQEPVGGQPPPPQAWQPPAPGAAPPAQGWGPPPGWIPTPQGWQPPPGWVPPPGVYPYPYGAPQVRPHGFALAGLGRRLVARLVDVFAVLILNVIVNGWFAYQWWLEVAPIFRESMQDPFGTPEQPSARSDYLILTMLFVATALWFAYEVPAIANSGQTLGKRLLQVKVFRLENTDQIGFGRAFRRWARLGLWTPFWSCYGFGLLLQAIDSLSPLFDPRLRQALHDKTAQTVVVAVPAGYRTPVQAKATDPSGGEK
jgi:uncharacterized RDD family membrane protein YckC